MGKNYFIVGLYVNKDIADAERVYKDSCVNPRLSIIRYENSYYEMSPEVVYKVVNPSGIDEHARMTNIYKKIMPGYCSQKILNFKSSVTFKPKASTKGCNNSTGFDVSMKYNEDSNKERMFKYFIETELTVATIQEITIIYSEGNYFAEQKVLISCESGVYAKS